MYHVTENNWHTMRKALNLTFNPKRMEEYLTIFNEQGSVLMDILREKENITYNPHHTLARCLIDTIIGKKNIEIVTN